MTKRTVNKEGLETIKRFEGLRLKAYRDARGKDPKWTIGYGHTSDAGFPTVYEGMVISEAEAERILLNDLARVESQVANAVEAPINDHQFSALVSLCFNIGIGAFRDSTLLKKLNARDYAGAQAQFAVWRKAGGKVLPGLINRRTQEAALFGKGEFVSSQYVDVAPDSPPVASKENISWAATILGSLGAAVSGTGPIQWALGILILVSGCTALYLFIKRRVQAG